jgi:muramoyltetrapeptide carboxypeptidase LdcA involved in peptidoglycan recycling
MRRLLPKKLSPESKIHLVYTSSPVYPFDEKHFANTLRRLEKLYPNTKVFEVIKKGLDPRYLAASENERLRIFRKASRNANWLGPIYGGTGCADIVRYLSKDDLANIRKNRPIVNGFSDTTFLINYLYFKLKLVTFLYANSSSLFRYTNYQEFLDVLTAKKQSLSYRQPNYHWLSPNAGPQKPIKGIAIGGNLETFRDLLDICQIQPRSWEDYILFMEDIGLDMEDLHRIIISLDQKGVFMHIKAVVVGSMNERSFKKSWLFFNRAFTNEKMADHMFEYLISDVIEERTQDRDPLYILKVDNFGHKDERGRDIYNEMIIPIGAKTILYPNGTIEFKGPFVE